VSSDPARDGFAYLLDKRFGLTCFELESGCKLWDDRNQATTRNWWRSNFPWRRPKGPGRGKRPLRGVEWAWPVLKRAAAGTFCLASESGAVNLDKSRGVLKLACAGGHSACV
jgi:hypothetical protein